MARFNLVINGHGHALDGRGRVACLFELWGAPLGEDAEARLAVVAAQA
jgi:hypothetical protein